ncbi:hypothetical protein GQ53DRAFT_413074 [Thozetella sp. PMI_491]|nr:hypothetical protein GQ53DRAFT_413074 [Thozetella sp. PMI_491]
MQLSAAGRKFYTSKEPRGGHRPLPWRSGASISPPLALVLGVGKSIRNGPRCRWVVRVLKIFFPLRGPRSGTLPRQRYISASGDRLAAALPGLSGSVYVTANSQRMITQYTLPVAHRSLQCKLYSDI